jgi:nucleoside-diphosphate-sugar epimerase
MIVGTGLIANAFSKGNFDHTNFIIFASGVSNSREERIEEYEKELTLLTNTLNDNQDKKLIYFSSCNITSADTSVYLQRKELIENYIKRNVLNHLILRLPNVVGHSTNRFQLLNYFYFTLLEQKDLTVKVNYIRHLLDVDDLPKVMELLTTLQIEASILNVAFDNGIKVKNIIEILEVAVGLRFKNIKEDNGENDYLINNNTFLQYVKDLNQFNTKPEDIIKKYYSKNILK